MIHQRSTPTHRAYPLPSHQHASPDSVRTSLFASDAEMRQSGFGSRPAPSSASQRSNLIARETSESLFEQQNNALASMLSDKVSTLKSLSIAIGEEAKSQNRTLDEVDSEFDSATSLLKGTVGKLGGMLKSGGSSHMCYLVLFICFIFFVVYALKR